MLQSGMGVFATVPPAGDSSTRLGCCPALGNDPVVFPSFSGRQAGARPGVVSAISDALQSACGTLFSYQSQPIVCSRAFVFPRGCAVNSGETVT